MFLCISIVVMYTDRENSSLMPYTSPDQGGNHRNLPLEKSV